MKRILAIVMMLVSASVMANTKVMMETSFGEIELELFDKKAPGTVKNFLTYVDDKFYDGTIFHRVIDNFMIQGGGFTTNLQKKSTKASVKNEANNGLSNDTGTIAMARTTDPHSATAQFFINVKDNNFLNHKSQTKEGWGYTVFGRVTKGMSVVNRIKKVQTTRNGPYRDIPAENIVIKKVYRKK